MFVYQRVLTCAKHGEFEGMIHWLTIIIPATPVRIHSPLSTRKYMVVNGDEW